VTRSRITTRFGGALVAAVAVGCASFPLEPYPKIVRDTDRRTRALHSNVESGGEHLTESCDKPTPRAVEQMEPAALTSRNRAAMTAGRSQAEIKSQLKAQWRPSSAPKRWPNYNGLLATRFSQLNTKPGPAFRPGTLTVQHLGQETRVPYIAAFHAGKRLPLVVGSSGINGTVDGKITVDILQHLYDTGDFHVVHLESITSVPHQVRNQRPFGGGFPEGLLLYETVAEFRSQPEFANEIDQVHLLGISFGGLLSGIAAHCEDHFREGVIDGAVLAFSPPIDLKTLFDNIAVRSIIHDRIHESYLEEGFTRMRNYVAFGMRETDPTKLDFDDYVRNVAVPYVRSIEPALRAKFPDLRPIETGEDVYAISDLRPFLGRLGVPYFYVYAYDDPVLSPEDHFHRVLVECPNPLVDGMLLKNGGHLGYDTLSDHFTARVAARYFRHWSPSLSRGACTMPSFRRAVCDEPQIAFGRTSSE
jgi:predicted alpha/beta-fold hydrolase